MVQRTPTRKVESPLQMIDIQSITDLELLRESVDLECKLAAGRDGKGALPEDFWPTYSAFANTEGGVVLLGVREKQGQFFVEGLVDVAKVRKQLFDALNNRQKVSVNLLTDASVREVVLQGRTILVVEIPRANRKHRPVHLTSNPFGGHTYRRLNDGDRFLPDDEVKRMIAEQVEDSRDGRILKGYDLKDLDMGTFRAYRQMFLMIGLGERAGSGMSRIVNGWRELGHTLELRERFEPQEHTVLNLQWASPPAHSPKSSPVPDQSTAERILLLLEKNPTMSTRSLGERLEISKRAVLKQIEKLKAQNRLRRLGSAKGGRWEVLSQESL